MKRAALHNLGCKVNSYELDAISKQLLNAGYEIVDFEKKADLYVINTCSVTNIADRKSRQMLHRAKKNNPEAVIAAIGCYVQTVKKEQLEAEGIDLCIGNNLKGQFINILNDYMLNREKCMIIKDLAKETQYDKMEIDSSLEHSRAFIKIQDGCNQFCSYCIIPYARGRVRSRDEESIIKEIKELSNKGYKEFVITGIHLSSYGTDFDYDDIKADRFGTNHLINILSKINNIAKVERIRLGSLEPRIITKEFMISLTGLSKVCPHFHLSLQSGSDDTLKRMNRHYSAEEFYEKCLLIREYYQHPAITTDIIVGFPGEDDREFQETKAFAKKADFYEMHIFKYSKRNGTIAATMKNQLTDAKKSNRSHELEIIEKECSYNFRKYYLGREEKILFEEEKYLDGENYWIGHNREYVKFVVKSEKNLANEIVKVKALDFLNEEFILGELI